MPRIRAGNIAEHKALTRLALLDGAFKLFVANGFAGTSLTDVASLASVGRTTLYEYFPNKEELFLALIEERVPPLLEAAISETPAAAPVPRMEAVFDVVFSVLGDNVDLAYVLFWVGRELPSDVRNRMWLSLWPINDELRSLCEAGIAAGVFPQANPALLHQCVADLLVGAVDQVLAMGYSEEAAAMILDARLRFLGNGLNG